MKESKKKITFVIAAVVIVVICIAVFAKFGENKAENKESETTSITQQETTSEKISETTSEATSIETEMQETKAPVKGKNIVEAYISVIRESQKGRDLNSLNDRYDFYYVHDMDMDGIKELIVSQGTCEADFLHSVYTYENGKAIHIGEIGGSHSDLYRKKDGGLYRCFASQGFCSVDIITKKGNKLIEEEGKSFEELNMVKEYSCTAKEAFDYMGSNYGELMSCRIDDLSLVKEI